MKNSPMRGMDSEVSGIFSAMASMKTENASRTVTPRAIFSPESGGRQKTNTVKVLIIIHGKTAKSNKECDKYISVRIGVSMRRRVLFYLYCTCSKAFFDVCEM